MHDPRTDEPFLAALTSAADEHADGVLAGVDVLLASTPHHRRVMAAALALIACHGHPGSRHHGRPEPVAAAARLVAHLAATQGPDGLFDGENLASPPDTAFTVNDLCDAHVLAARDPATAGLAAMLEKIADAAREALLHGGVHTPNHRWELSAALARLHRSRPDDRLPARVDEWLAEGVDVGPDGVYSERSPLYAAHVTNPSLVAIGTILDRPELLDAVRANLGATLATTLPDGTVETVASRRQDQKGVIRQDAFGMQFRRFAIVDGRGDFAEAATGPIPDPAAALTAVLLEPWLAGALPPPVPPGPVRRLLPTSGLVVVRDGRFAVTVNGGSDHARHGRIRSGLANNPTFLRMLAGDAVLDGLRLSRDFFGMGPFRAAGIVDDGTEIVLREEVAASYYGPLPAEHRSPDGRYRLVDDGRFSASMDFPNRPADVVALATEIRVRPRSSSRGTGGVDVEVAVSSERVGHTLVLTFRPGGTLTGGPVLDAAGVTYRQGSDTITVTADRIGDRVVPYHPGEEYTLLDGTDALDGVTVLVPVAGRTTLHLDAS